MHHAALHQAVFTMSHEAARHPQESEQLRWVCRVCLLKYIWPNVRDTSCFFYTGNKSLVFCCSWKKYSLQPKKNMSRNGSGRPSVLETFLASLWQSSLELSFTKFKVVMFFLFYLPDFILTSRSGVWITGEGKLADILGFSVIEYCFLIFSI